jgi:hypothetical protein
MNTDLIKLLAIIWMAGMGYLLYEMYVDLNYLTDLFQAYVKMIVGHSRH